MTIPEIAEAIGISEYTYEICEIKNRMSSANLKALAKFYGTDYEQMKKGVTITSER